MKVQLGWVCFLVTVTFACGLVVTLIGTTWFGVSDRNGLIGFFGFGIPMMASGAGTDALWSDEKPLQKMLGWTSAVFGLVCSVALFILVVGWVLSDNESNQPNVSIAHFLGFGIPMVYCGGFGIYLLFESEGKKGPF